VEFAKDAASSLPVSHPVRCGEGKAFPRRMAAVARSENSIHVAAMLDGLTAVGIAGAGQIPVTVSRMTCVPQISHLKY